MKKTAIRSLIAFFAVFVIAVTALAQQANPNIIVPKSSVRKAMKGGVRRAFTNYKIFVGPWNRRSIDDWKAEAGEQGPAFQQTIQGYHPADIQAAYKMPANGGTQAIAIVDAFHLPTSLNDFNVFSAAFGLPQETSSNPLSSSNKVFQVVYATGSKPDADGDWGGEIALDIEWAHAMAPNAKIYLIEAASDSINDLMVGVRYAATQLSDVRQISMSFGTLEFSSEQQFDTNFTGANKVFFASAGDNSNEVNYPAASTKVIGVGGTSLAMSSGVVTSETAWSDSGGGPSVIIARPSFQDPVAAAVGAKRGTPDIAAIGDPQTGCAIYISTDVPDAGKGWLIFGGTSLSAPVCAGITNTRGQFAGSTLEEQNREYAALGGSQLRDITAGTSGSHSAKAGYDFVTGVGVPIGVTSTGTTTNSFPPTAITRINGVVTQGVPANMIVKDSHDYVLRSVTSGGQKLTIGGTFQLKVNAAAISSYNVKLTGMTTHSPVTLSFFNVATSTWDDQSSFALGLTNGSKTYSSSNSLSGYVDANGNLKFRLSASSSGSSFTLGIDQIQFNANITTQG